MINISGTQPFFLCRYEDGSGIWATGKIRRVRRLAEIAPPAGQANEARVDAICAVPFCQIRELGFEVVDGGEPIICLDVESSTSLDDAALRRLIAPGRTALAPAAGFDWDDTHYERVIQDIVENEINQGAGSNFVVPREFRGSLVGFNHNTALRLFRNLLEHEYGAYWTFLFYADGTYLIGASPERLVSSFGSAVMMNPISGTFRKTDCAAEALNESLLGFLKDEKEIFELFMVVDEELKVMAEICPLGGRIDGPYLKEMSHVVHTEYLLSGRSAMPVMERFREAMFAATVVGSPIQNACRVVKRYRPRSRRYYGSAIAMFGRDPNGPTLDSAITIRTAEIDAQGEISVQVGATLVRDSVPKEEVKETHAKISGLMRAAGIGHVAEAGPPHRLGSLLQSERVREEFVARNRSLSRFWFVDREAGRGDDEALPLAGKSVVVIDFEDNFTRMLKHVLASLGTEVSIVSWQAATIEDIRSDIVVLGPGPGDPSDTVDPRIVCAYEAARSLLRGTRPFMAACLGHQVLCRALGFELFRKRRTTQGTQQTINLFEKVERVGFYNTFAARQLTPRAGVEVSASADGEVFAIRTSRFVGFQFHVESILTEHGPDILSAAILGILPQSSGHTAAVR